jgi:DNA-binding response OmpR family regulator
MAAALEAVLFGLMNKQSLLSPSLRRTTAQIIEFFEELFVHARQWPPVPARTAQALVVDDDPLSNRLAVSALCNARVQASSTSRPLDALRLFEQNHYDLILLDIEMEGMKGFELSRRLRTLPGYLRTPVIFVTAHTDFDVRVKTIEAGGDDLIAKPILPVELAAKAVMHLLKIQMLTIPMPEAGSVEPLPQHRLFDRQTAPHETARSHETAHTGGLEVDRLSHGPAARQQND